MDYPIKTISQLRPILRAFRKERGLTQKELAQRLNISQQRYAQMEARPEAVSLDQLLGVLQILGVELTLSPKSAPPQPPAQLIASDHETPPYLPDNVHKENW